MLVSTSWRDAVRTIPLAMRIEDRNKNQIWYHRPSLNISDEYNKNEAPKTINCPLYNIGCLPMSVRGRVKKLTAVLRLAKQHTHRYDLNSIRDLLKGFSRLESLTLISELGPGDFFVSVFRHPNSLPSLRQLRVIQYLLHGQLGHVVKAAPNLESLRTTTILEYCSLGELLPLSKSLRTIQICNDDCRTREYPGYYYEGDSKGFWMNHSHGCWGDVDQFISQMPLLEAWHFGKGQFVLGRQQPAVKNHHLLDPIENWGPTSRKNIRVFKNMRSHDRNQGRKSFLDRYLHWYLGLKEEDKRRPEIHDLFTSVDFQFDVHPRLWTTDIENKALHAKIRNDFWLDQDDFGNKKMLGMWTPHTDVEGIEKHKYSYWTRVRYARKRKIFAKLQERYNYHTDCFRKLIPSEEYDFDGNVHSASNNGLVVYDYSYIY